MFSEQTQESESPQHGGGHDLVHVTRPGIPPRPTAVIGRRTGTRLAETVPAKFAESRPWALPLTPHDAAQFPTQPLVEILEARLDLR